MSLSEELAGAASAAGASAAVSTPSGRVSYMICWSHHDIFAPSLSQGMVWWTKYYPLVKRLEIDAHPPATVTRNMRFNVDLAAAVHQDRVQQNHQRLHGTTLTVDKVLNLSNADSEKIERLCSGDYTVLPLSESATSSGVAGASQSVGD